MASSDTWLRSGAVAVSQTRCGASLLGDSLSHVRFCLSIEFDLRSLANEKNHSHVDAANNWLFGQYNWTRKAEAEYHCS
jgi:hypothetical protein